MQTVRIKWQPIIGAPRGYPSHAWFVFPANDPDATAVAGTTDLSEAVAIAYDYWRWQHRANIHYSEARH